MAIKAGVSIDNRDRLDNRIVALRFISCAGPI